VFFLTGFTGYTLNLEPSFQVWQKLK